MAEIVEHNKYNSSRIYKIQSSLTDKIYIGSTCQALSQRMAGHMSDYNKYLNDNTKSNISSFEIIKLNDAYISLIEECNFNNRQQLEKREGEIIKEHINICVNKLIAGRTRNEWRDDNKQELIKYRHDNKEHIAKRDKIYYNNNKQVIREKAKELYLCDCGKTSTITQKTRHIKTTKHLQLINKLYVDELTYYIL